MKYLALAVLALSACSAASAGKPAPEHTGLVHVSAVSKVHAFEQLVYSGRWEFIRGRNDGRYMGSSARSHRSGDAVSIVFRGRRLRIFGVKGSNGGRADVIVPGRAARLVQFYDPSPKAPHRLVYDSGFVFGSGVHTAGLVVVDRVGRSAGYVNIDEFQVAQ